MENIDNNTNQNMILIKPIRSYNNADLNKEEICQENKNKNGIYRWTNIISGKSYIGSAIILSRRFRCYFNINFLLRELKTNNSLIYKALIKYGYSSFKVDILEYCNKSFFIKREQYYIDNLLPEYNTLKVAGSLIGFKHSTFSKERMRLAKLAKPLNEARRLKLYSFSGALALTVVNNKTGEVTSFTSIRKTAKYIGIQYSYLVRCLLKNKFYEGKGYFISKSK